jgi:hypothetical protein
MDVNASGHMSDAGLLGSASGKILSLGFSAKDAVRPLNLTSPKLKTYS